MGGGSVRRNRLQLLLFAPAVAFAWCIPLIMPPGGWMLLAYLGVAVYLVLAMWARLFFTVIPLGRGGDWATARGQGLPRPGRGLPNETTPTRSVRVGLDPDAQSVIAVMRRELEASQSSEPDDPEPLPFFVWLAPAESPRVVVHAGKHRLGAVEDDELYRLVQKTFDARHPRHCHTGAELTRGDHINVTFCTSRAV